VDNFSRFKLGRRAPKRTPSLRLSSYLTGNIPTHPDAADHFSAISDWGLYGNDHYGDCGPVSVANQRKLVTKYLTGTEVSPSQDDVFDLYKRSGNPAFPAEDNGVDMQTMLEAVVAGGIGGTKAIAFASVDPKNLDEIDAAIAIFGSVLFGVTLETAQQSQSSLWEYAQSGIWGGHAVLAGRYGDKPTGEDTAVVTWGRVVGTTDALLQNQLEECWIVVWPEHLGSVTFQEGVNLSMLMEDYKALTGRDFPFDPGPPPQPPTPDPGPLPGPPPGPVNKPGCLARLFGRR
jgi:hypothetical protein